MSEERFDRLENQLSQVIHSIAVMQQNMATKSDLAVLEQKSLWNRAESLWNAG